jgi:hypothetical protein
MGRAYYDNEWYHDGKWSPDYPTRVSLAKARRKLKTDQKLYPGLKFRIVKYERIGVVK